MVDKKGVIPFFCPSDLINHFITISKIIIMQESIDNMDHITYQEELELQSKAVLIEYILRLEFRLREYEIFDSSQRPEELPW